MPTPQFPITTEVTPCHKERADRRVPADLRVVMRVRVDKAGRDDETVGIDGLRRPIGDPADFGDPAVLDRHIGLAPGRAGAVDHGAVLDQQVVTHPRASSTAARR
jgi:hypothetical protein